MLAFKLLRKASITGDDKKLCLTGMDFSEKDKLYDQAKKSLKKYCTDGNFASASTSAETVKLEHGVKQEVFAVGGLAGFYDNASQRFWPSHRPFRTNSESRSWKTGSVRGRGISERPLNPLGNDGKPLRCKGCGSYRHFLDACPESRENMNRAANRVRFMKDHEYEEESYFHSEDSDGECYPNYVMITENDQLELTTFSVEAQNCAVLDTACGSTVCGQQWVSTYMDSVGRDQVSLVQPGGFSTFKFGAGPIIPSWGTYEILIRMAGIRIQLRTVVVDCDIPLLLSKTAMKKAGVVINMNDDTAVIFGKSVPLNTPTSGHYCVPIHSEYSVEDVAEILVVQQIPAAEQVKTFLKLHRQFGHPAQHKLISLLKDAGTWKEEYKLNMDKIHEKCQQSGLCRFKDRITRPVVAMSLASDFNEKIAMDLKKWNGRWILHIVDLWSRFTVSAFIPRKRPTDVIHAVMTEWCSIFGVPQGVLTDNGGEFVSEMLEVESMLNTEVLSTAAESPFQNGLCERNHQVVDSILTKLVQDFPSTPVDILLKWSCMAKNSLQIHEGFSSHQLVLGGNPNLPNVISSSPSSLEASTTSEKFAKHINSLHAARKAFIESESCEKIKRSLKSKIRASQQVFNPGDKVYYKRDNQERWLGPAKVIFRTEKLFS